MPTLHSWISQLKNKANSPTKENDSSKDIAALIEENRRLHKELAQTKEDLPSRLIL